MDREDNNIMNTLLDNEERENNHYIENMPKSLRRSIWLVQDEENDETYTADEILDGKPQGIIFDIRHSLYASYKSGKYKYVCKLCQQPLSLKVRTHEGDFFPFFSHFQNSNICPLKNIIDIDPTQSVRNQENEFKSSILYQLMIERLKDVLSRTVSFANVEENKIISKPEIKGYRKPAIYSHYNDCEVCFDLLVSNPLISLLVCRNAFYKLHKMYYLWLFPSFTKSHQRLCQKDILYMNRRNVFVFDSKDFYTSDNKVFCGQNTNSSSHLYAYEESIRQNRLLLNCYWQTPEISEVNGTAHISIKWNGPQLVAFDDLIFDNDTFEVYYHDSNEDFYNSYPLDVQRQIDEWLKIKKDRWAKIFDSIEKRKILHAQFMERQERKEKLKYYHSLIRDDEAEVEIHYDDESKLYGFRIDSFDVIPPMYYDAKPFYCGFAWVRKKERWGVIDYFNNRITKFQYSALYELEDGMFYAYKNQKNILVDYKGEQIGTTTFDNIEIIKPGLYKIGNTIVTEHYRSYGFYSYSKTETLWGLINSSGENILPCQFDSVSIAENGKIKVSLNNNTGYINEDGHEEYEIFDKGDIIIYKSPLLGKFGLMDKNKHILTGPTYDYIGDFCDGLAVVKIQHNYGYTTGYGIITKAGNLITDNAHHNDVKILRNGLYAIYQNSTFTLKSIHNSSFSQDYERIGVYNDKYIAVLRENRWGIIDYDGNIVIPFEYSEIVEFRNGSVIVKKSLYGKEAEINWDGEETYIIHSKKDFKIYESRLLCKYGLMDISSNPITELVYDNLTEFNDNILKASTDKKWGLIDKHGKVILPFEFDQISDHDSGFAKVRKNRLWGLIDDSNNLVLPIKYDAIGEIEDGFVRVKKRQWWKKIKIHRRQESIESKNTIDLSKIEEGVIYDAISTGTVNFGVFIKIPDIGCGLIHSTELLKQNRKLNEFKKGTKIRVQLVNKDIQKNRATFKISE